MQMLLLQYVMPQVNMPTHSVTQMSCTFRWIIDFVF